MPTWRQRINAQPTQTPPSNPADVVQSIAAKLSRYAEDGTLTMQQLVAINNLATDRNKLLNLLKWL